MASTMTKKKHKWLMGEHDVFISVIRDFKRKYNFDEMEDIEIYWIDEEDNIMDRELGIMMKATCVTKDKED